MSHLIISADDYGYARRYDEGILDAASAGAIDAVAVMVGRPGMRPGPLLATGVEIGLHLELGYGAEAGRAGERERREAEREIGAQIERFAELFGSPPGFVDGHHHCHARPGIGVVVSDLAVEHGLVVRSIDPRHRRLLRCRGVSTPDLLLGRLGEGEPVLPKQLQSPRGTEVLAELAAVVEWMVHPGRPDPGAGSRYDAARLEDLEAVLAFEPGTGLQRCTHRVAFGLADPA